MLDGIRRSRIKMCAQFHLGLGEKLNERKMAIILCQGFLQIGVRGVAVQIYRGEKIKQNFAIT